MSTTVPPLDAVWWQAEQTALPADDIPLLAPYAATRPGFEVLQGESDDFQAIGDGRYQVCVWFIWAKDDPAERDPKKQRINAMQQMLGSLDDETRYIRLQIACVNRCYYAYPATINTVLRGIASGTAQLDMNLSCEPPWHDMRLILRRRRGLPKELDERQMLAHAYLAILTCWLGTAELEWVQGMLPMHAALAETIYRRLGPPDDARSLQVQRLCSALLFWAFPSAESREPRWDRLTRLQQAQSSLLTTASGEDTLGQLIAWNNDRGTCHHSFFRHLDYQIAMIGAGGPVELPGKGDERRRIETAMANYVFTLGSWLAQRTVEEAAGIWRPAEETIRNVYGILGKSTPTKRWLVACLWKHLQENQAHQGRGVLDTEPERFTLPEEALAIG